MTVIDTQNSAGHKQGVEISGILSELQNDNSESSSNQPCWETIDKVKLTLRKELLTAHFSKLQGNLDADTTALKVHGFCEFLSTLRLINCIILFIIKLSRIFLHIFVFHDNIT